MGVSLSEQHNDLLTCHCTKQDLLRRSRSKQTYTCMCAIQSRQCRAHTGSRQFPPGNINKGDMKGNGHLLVKDEIFGLNKTHVVDTTRRFWSQKVMVFSCVLNVLKVFLNTYLQIKKLRTVHLELTYSRPQTAFFGPAGKMGPVNCLFYFRSSAREHGCIVLF